MKPLMLLAMLALLPGMAGAAPSISIGTMNDYMRADKNVVTKRIHNSGVSTAFVKVRVWELVRRADGSVEEIPLDTAGANGERELVVSPARLIIPASGTQTVRLLFNGERSRERYFRLRFNPVVPEGGDGLALTEAEAQRYDQAMKVQGGVQVLAGFGSLLYVRPTQVHHALAVEKTQAGFVVRNTGNATAVLDQFRRCAGNAVDCEAASVQRLAPGAMKTFERKPGETYVFEHLRGALAAQPYEIKGQPGPLETGTTLTSRSNP